MRSVPLPFLSKITLLWTRAREPGPVSPVKVDSPLPFPWTQRGEIYRNGEYFRDDSNITSHIRRLRKKIEDDPSRPEYIQTVRGVGYRMNMVKKE